jgi:hypothetical protein
MNQGPKWVLLMKKKNGGGKSHATVPLSFLCSIGIHDIQGGACPYAGGQAIESAATSTN